MVDEPKSVKELEEFHTTPDNSNRPFTPREATPYLIRKRKSMHEEKLKREGFRIWPTFNWQGAGTLLRIMEKNPDMTVFQAQEFLSKRLLLTELKLDKKNIPDFHKRIKTLFPESGAEMWRDIVIGTNRPHYLTMPSAPNIDPSETIIQGKDQRRVVGNIRDRDQRHRARGLEFIRNYNLHLYNEGLLEIDVDAAKKDLISIAERENLKDVYPEERTGRWPHLKGKEYYPNVPGAETNVHKRPMHIPIELFKGEGAVDDLLDWINSKEAKHFRDHYGNVSEFDTHSSLKGALVLDNEFKRFIPLSWLRISNRGKEVLRQKSYFNFPAESKLIANPDPFTKKEITFLNEWQGAPPRAKAHIEKFQLDLPEKSKTELKSEVPEDKPFKQPKPLGIRSKTGKLTLHSPSFINVLQEEPEIIEGESKIVSDEGTKTLKERGKEMRRRTLKALPWFIGPTIAGGLTFLQTGDAEAAGEEAFRSLIDPSYPVADAELGSPAAKAQIAQDMRDRMAGITPASEFEYEIDPVRYQGPVEEENIQEKDTTRGRFLKENFLNINY